MRRRAGRLAGIALVLGVAAAVWWQVGSAPDGAPPAAVAVVPKASGTASWRNVPFSVSVPAGDASAAASTKLPLDAVGGALDLKRVFDDYAGSADPRARRIAARALDACIPAFLPTAAQTPSPEPLIRALPAQQRAERESAYWSLFARCRGFVADSRASLESAHDRLQADAEAQEPGLRAQQDLLAGRTDRIDALVSQALNAAEPAAVASLAGVASRMAQQRTAASVADPALLRRALAVDAALPSVACDLGLDCSASSLSALQLCAVQGSCDGDLTSRSAQAYGGSADAADVQRERARLLALIRSGRSLTSADLLP